MSFEKQFDDMIEAGKNVIYADFDPVAFQQWRAHAITCLGSLMEQDPAYANYFIKPLHSEAHPRTPECRFLEKGSQIASHSLDLVPQITVDL